MALADLPDAVAAVDTTLGLHVCELVLDGAARRVVKPVEHHPGCLHVQRLQVKVLLQLVDHGVTADVDAKVLECQFEELQDVRLDLGFEELLGDKCYEEEQLRWLKSSTAPPLTRNRQLGINMDLRFPKYQFWVMFSVLTTTAYVLWCTYSMLPGEVDGDDTGAAGHPSKV
jgi:hypothetical protein